MRACGEMTHDYPSKQASGIHLCGREEKTKRVSVHGKEGELGRIENVH